jgi:hypothetical protein
MFFNSYLIFTQIALVIILYQLVSRWVANRHLRNLLIALANIILLLNVVKEHSIIVLAVLCAVIYALALIIQKKQSKPILGISLGLVIGLFAFRNYPFLLSMLEEGTFESRKWEFRTSYFGFVTFWLSHIKDRFKNMTRSPFLITFSFFLAF